MKANNKAVQKRLMDQHQQRMQVVNLVAMCNALYDSGMSLKKINEFVIKAMEELHRLADEMTSNTCIQNGAVRIDKEYNSDKLREACEMYGIPFERGLYA